MILEDSIHIEPSSRCTLLCPQCPRTEYLDRISSEDCDIDDLVIFCGDIRQVVMCGNHGDPIYHAQFHRLVNELRCARADRQLRIITNGAFRSESWWTELGSILDHRFDSITFSIDGLPENNNRYRINSRWASIEKGINALRVSNPNLMMTWKWILFHYNQDCVIRGIELASELGFDSFMLVKSVRYEQGHYLTPSRSHDQIKDEVVQWCQLHHVAN